MSDAGDPLLDLVGYRDISSSGTTVPRRSSINIVGGTATDNPTLGATDINVSGLSVGASVLAATADLATGTLNRYDGSVVATYSLPDSPTSGDVVGVAETTGGTATITFDGNGNNLADPTAGTPATPGATMTISQARASMFWKFDGTIWLLQSSPVTPAGGTVSTLQDAYEGGPNILVTTDDGTVSISNVEDTTDALTVARSFAGEGEGIALDMATGTTGIGLHVTSDSGSTGTALQVDQNGIGDALSVSKSFAAGGTGIDVEMATGTTGRGVHITALSGSIGTALEVSQIGSGAALIVNGVGASQLTIDASGAVNVTAAAGQNFDATAVAGSGKGFNVSMPTGATGIGVHVTSDSGSTGVALQVDANGSGAAMSVNGVGASRIDLNAAGQILIDSETGQNATIGTLGAGFATFRSSTGQARVVSQASTSIDSTNGNVSIDSALIGNINLQTQGLTRFQVVQVGSVNCTPASGQNFDVDTTGGGDNFIDASDTGESRLRTSGSGAVFVDATGTGAVIINSTGASLNMRTSGTNRLVISNSGSIANTPASAQNFTITTAGTGIIDLVGITRLFNSTVAGLPTAANVGGMIFVTDETGGAVPAFSDGTNWRRVTDRTIVA